jgi:hypothetical protein
MDIETLKTLYKVTFSQEEMYEIMMAAHHYIMREYPEFGEMFEKANIDIFVSVTPPDEYC